MPRPRSAPSPAEPSPDAATVLVVGFPAPVVAELLEAPPPGSRLVPAPDPAAADRALATEAVRALCLGPCLEPRRARPIVDRALELAPRGGVAIVILGAGDDLTPFRDLVDADLLFYLGSGPLPPAEIRALLGRAIRPHPLDRPVAPVPASAIEALLRLLATLDEEDDEGSVSRLTAQAIRALVDADGGECMIFDRAGDTLLAWRPGTDEPRRESAAAGLVGWVARMAAPVRVERAGSDPRYEPEADADGGTPRDRLMVVPAVASGIGGEDPSPAVRAVLVARRSQGKPPFDEVEEATLALLADQLAAALDRLALRRRVYGGVGASSMGSGPSSVDGAPLFRREALARRADDGRDRGRPLALAPAWTRRTYQLLLWLFIASVALLSWGSVHEYAEGVAVVRVPDRIDVPATAAGVVERSVALPGRTVEAGDLLVLLDRASQTAELERLRRELELALVDRLRHPAARQGAGAVGTLREQLRLAEARLEERAIRAPAAGVVLEGRVEAGQPVSPGQTVATLATGQRDLEPNPSVVVLFPGRYRLLLGEGMALRLELEGHPGARHPAHIVEVGDGVVGPAEARRILASDVADAIPVVGPVVLVRARLSSATFTRDGRTFRYHDGLVGRAEVRVRSGSLLSTLVPGLEGFLGGEDE